MDQARKRLLDGPYISVCSNNRHFERRNCPVCGLPADRLLPYRAGDCVACSALCGLDRYCCNSPRPTIGPDPRNTSLS